jgi:hypothetical protein
MQSRQIARVRCFEIESAVDFVALIIAEGVNLNEQFDFVVAEDVPYA